MTSPWTAFARFWSCKKCSGAWAVLKHDPDVGLLKSRMRCPNYDRCKGHLREVSKAENAARMPALSLWQSIMGMGTPEQRKCSPKELEKVLSGAKVKAVVLECHANPGRSIIHTLSLDNGKTIHFAGSPSGAVVYKVT